MPLIKKAVVDTSR